MPKISPLSLKVLTNIFRTSPKDPMRIINREGSMKTFHLLLHLISEKKYVALMKHST